MKRLAVSTVLARPWLRWSTPNGVMACNAHRLGSRADCAAMGAPLTDTMQSRAAEPYLLLCGVTREDVLRRFVFIEGPNSCHQASTAALKVASYLPFPYSALSIFMIIPAPIRDAVYDYVATRRYHWFGKSRECILPTEDVLDRFVDKLEIQERMAQDQDDEEQVEENP